MSAPPTIVLDPKYLIIEIDGYEGTDTAITVENLRDIGKPNRLYSIGVMRDDGVVEIIDSGYATIEEAQVVCRIR